MNGLCEAFTAQFVFCGTLLLPICKARLRLFLYVYKRNTTDFVANKFVVGMEYQSFCILFGLNGFLSLVFFLVEIADFCCGLLWKYVRAEPTASPHVNRFLIEILSSMYLLCVCKARNLCKNAGSIAI